MRKLVGALAALVMGFCLVVMLCDTGMAVPVEDARLPLSLQKLMDNPVLQVKECKKWKICAEYKHSTACYPPDLNKILGHPECCKHWKWHKECDCDTNLDKCVGAPL